MNSRVAARFHASFIATRARKESGQKVHSRAAGSVGGTYIIQYGEDRFLIVIIFFQNQFKLNQFQSTKCVGTRCTSVLHISYSAQ